MRHPNGRHALMLLLVFFLRGASSETAPGVFCDIAGRSQRSNELREVARKLIAIQGQLPPDSASLAQSTEALRVCGLFETVHVEQSRGRVTFLLTPARYVRDIRIGREFPLFEDDVEKAMYTYPGDVFRDGVLERQDSSITALYLREGFVSPRIDVTSREHRNGSDRIVLVRVHAGPYYRMKTLAMEGNRALSDFRIKYSMKSWRSSLVPGSAGRFVAAVLRKDIESLLALYRSKGFVDVKIRETVTTDSSARSVRVVLSINEGARYRILFPPRRDRGCGKGTLRNDLAFFKTGNRSNPRMKKSTRAIEKRMRAEGFLEARAASSDTTLQRRLFLERLIRISIQRGPRTTVSSITIRGATSLDEELIRGQMLHTDKGSPSKRAYNPEKLQDDVFAVRMLYRSRGFLRATVASTVTLRDQSAALTITVREGSCTRIGEVSAATGRFPGINAGEAITTRNGDAFRGDLLKRDARVLQAMIAERGYPHAEVTPVVAMNDDSSKADVEFRIAEGPRITMGDIHYVGAFRTRKKVLNREIRIFPGKPLSLKDIVETQKRIRDLGPFGSVRFKTIGLREKRDTVHVFVEVTEKRPYFGTLGGGYRSDKGPFVNAKAGDRNVLGLNKEAWVGGEVSRVGGRGDIGLLEPRFLGSRIRAMAEVFGERTVELNQDWGINAYSITTGLIAAPIGRIVLGLGTRYERRRLFFENQATVDTLAVSEDQRPRNIVVATPSFAWEGRDSFTRPRKGAALVSSIDISKSIGTAIDDIMKVQIEAKGCVTPFSPLTFAGVARGGYCLPYGGSVMVPLDQHFYLGGTGDVRGFGENLFHPADSSGGTAMLFASIEARIDIGFNIELAVFSDVGRLENDFSSISPDQFRSSAGAGIRYITPVGPIGILYGRKFSRKPGESIGAFHFSIGYTF